LIARTRQDGAGFGGQVQVGRNNEREAGSAGFSTTELPAAKAAAILQAANIMGKFQDTMAATMPKGSRWIRPRTLGDAGAIIMAKGCGPRFGLDRHVDFGAIAAHGWLQRVTVDQVGDAQQPLFAFPRGGARPCARVKPAAGGGTHVGDRPCRDTGAALPVMRKMMSCDGPDKAGSDRTPMNRSHGATGMGRLAWGSQQGVLAVENSARSGRQRPAITRGPNGRPRRV